MRRSDTSVAAALLAAADRLRREVDRLEFSAPVTHVYNPLSYASSVYEAYIRKFAQGPKQIVFLGMNPGPFGMTQTGVPFGEIKAVRDWLRLSGSVGRPLKEHPRRPVTGFTCPRSEVSGSRLWGFFANEFGEPERFFAQHIVMNYCPLAFIEASGRNRTPDKLPRGEREPLFAACDAHLREIVHILQPGWLIGIGDFAFKRAREVFPSSTPRLGRVLHPSPANPQANLNWVQTVRAELHGMGIWRKPQAPGFRRRGSKTQRA